MDPKSSAPMSPAERELFTAMEERLRQLRRKRGVPNGVSLVDAVALHMLSTDEVEQARWGDERSLLLGAESDRATPVVVVPPAS